MAEAPLTPEDVEAIGRNVEKEHAKAERAKKRERIKTMLASHTAQHAGELIAHEAEPGKLAAILKLEQQLEALDELDRLNELTRRAD